MVRPQGFIGVQLAPLNADVRRQLSYQGQGVAIVGVVGGSAADKAGLEPGDVIQKVDGKPVSQPVDVASVVQKTAPGHTVSLNVWNAGNKRLVGVQVGASPDQTG